MFYRDREVVATYKRETKERLKTLENGLRVLGRQGDKPSPELLRERVQQRQQQGQDASEADLAVLESQLAHVQPLAAEELPQALLLDVSQPVDWPRLLAE